MRPQFDGSPSILPEQLLTRRHAAPESRLAAALIEQAIADSREIHAASGLRKRALEWCNGAPALLSFDQACALAGIDAQAAKRAIEGARSCGARRLTAIGAVPVPLRRRARQVD
jgi:hypothetical protein